MKEMNQNYILGKFKKPEDTTTEIKHRSPANLEKLLGAWSFGFKDIDRAIDASMEGKKKWSALSLKERHEILLRVIEHIQGNSEGWTKTLCEHSGMCLEDAKEELARTIQISKQQLSHSLQNELEKHFKEEWQFDPLGTVAVIGSFSESLVFGFGECLRYLIAGNSVVYKPSERLFVTGYLIAQAFDFAELPAGVFNLIYGDREVGRRLAVHEGIDCVSFMGGYESAVRIKQDTLTQSWKKLSLWMCGKSSLIIDETASLDQAVAMTLQGAFSYSGQCADSTSRVLVHSSLKDQFIESLHKESKLLKVGGIDVPAAKMGALIDEGAVDRYIKFQGIALREGAEVLMRGKALDLDIKGNFVTPSIVIVKNNDFETNRRSVYLQTEIFGPNVAVQFFNDKEEAITIANNNQFPFAAAVLGKGKDVFSVYSKGIKYSRIIFNQSTRAPAFELPYTGTKKSGNQSLGGALGFLDAGISRAIIK